MLRGATLIFILGSVFSCTEKKVVYENLAFRNNNVKMWRDTIPAKWKEIIENGEFTTDDERGNIIAQGNFKNGLRVGIWTYHPSDTQTIEIEWAKYSNNDQTVIINYPKTWDIHEVDKRPFQATFPTTSEIKKDKFFIIMPQNKDSIGMDLEGYWRHYNTIAFEDEKTKEYALFKFETASDKSFYFSRYVLERNNEEILIFSFLGEIGSTIYDITYSSLSEENERKHIIFFDMLRSLTLEEQRFFSPYDPVKNFRQLEKPEKIEKPQTVS